MLSHFVNLVPQAIDSSVRPFLIFQPNKSLGRVWCLLPTFLLGFFKRAALGYNPLGWSLSHTFLYFLREMWFENPQDRQPTPYKRTGMNAWARPWAHYVTHMSGALGGIASAHRTAWGDVSPCGIRHQPPTIAPCVQITYRMRCARMCATAFCADARTHRAPLWRGTPRGVGAEEGSTQPDTSTAWGGCEGVHNKITWLMSINWM